MSTVGEVIDRVYREYLSLADDQPVQAPLGVTMDDTTTSLTLTSSGLDPDEAEVYVAGTLIEVGWEMMLLTNVNMSTFPATIVMTVRREMAGTTAAAHTAGDLVTASPTFPRLSVFDAVADNVEGLYPSLYHVASSAVTTAAYTEVPAATIDPLHFTYLSGGKICRSNVMLLSDLPVAMSSTGKAATFSARNGLSGTLVYRAQFDRPTAEADDLATIGVEAQWERVVVVGAAAQVLAGRELDQVTQEYVTEQMRGQGYPVESASRQRNELLRLYQILLGQASSRQMAERDELVTMSMPQFGSLR